MTTIYIVSSGYYSAYEIDGVYDDRELAEKHASLIQEGRVEEFELNAYADKLKQGLSLYHIAMKRDGEVPYIRKYGDEFHEQGFKVRQERNGAYNMEGFVWAMNEQHAIKIANEKRAQLIANNEWPVDDVMLP